MFFTKLFHLICFAHSRDTVKANVFGMGIAPPTMSLEEFGDLQKMEAMERSAREAAAPSGTRKYVICLLENTLYEST